MAGGREQALQVRMIVIPSRRFRLIATRYRYLGSLQFVRLAEDGDFALLARNDIASTARALRECGVSFTEMPVDRALALLDRLIVAVVNHAAGHSAEDRLGNIQELRTTRK